MQHLQWGSCRLRVYVDVRLSEHNYLNVSFAHPALDGRTKLRWKLVALFVSSLMSLVLCELGLRLFFRSDFPVVPNEKSLMYRYDQQLGWFPIPNSERELHIIRDIDVVHNQEGFRDVEHAAASDKPGLLFLGDSFVWGYGVEGPERFTDKLQARHPEWEIFNCGVSGYGTDQEYLLLEDYFDRFKPRMVVLIYCTGNDEADNRWNFRYESYFKPFFTTNAFGLQLHGVPVPRSPRSYFAGHPRLSRSLLLRLIIRSTCQIHAPPILHVPSPTFAIISAMQKYLKHRGSGFAVGLTATNPYLETFLAKSRIPYVDLSTKNRFPDGHWNPKGHDFVCNAIDQFLSQPVIASHLSTNVAVQ